MTFKVANIEPVNREKPSQYAERVGMEYANAGIVGDIYDKEIIKKIKRPGTNNITGAIMDPFTAFLITRGLQTLDIRMERHCENAQKIAEFLEKHPAIEKVFYPGLPSFEGYEIAKRQNSKACEFYIWIWLWS